MSQMTQIVYEVRSKKGMRFHVRENMPDMHFRCGLPLDSPDIYSAIPLYVLIDHFSPAKQCTTCCAP